MVRAKGILLVSAFFAAFLWLRPAAALESYSEAQTTQFMDWCTGAKAATESACSCTLKRLAQTVAPAALAGFINQQSGGGGFSLSTTAVTTAALVTDALVACSK